MYILYVFLSFFDPKMIKVILYFNMVSMVTIYVFIYLILFYIKLYIYYFIYYLYIILFLL